MLLLVWSLEPVNDVFADGVVSAKDIDTRGIFVRNDVREDFVLVDFVHHDASNEVLSQIVVVKVVCANGQNLRARMIRHEGITAHGDNTPEPLESRCRCGNQEDHI